MMQTHNCALALGSNWCQNIADTRSLVDASISWLQKERVNILAISAFYQTKAFPANGDPDFVNAAILLETELSPNQLLKQMHEIENRLGRTRSERWERRVIDIDILFYDDDVRPDEKTHETWRDMTLSDQMVRIPDQLIVPHPRLQDRPFVLVPLCDVAPHWVHPILHKSVKQMHAALDDQALAGVTPL